MGPNLQEGRYLPVIFFSLVTSFIRAPRGSEEEEEDGTATEASREVAEADTEPGGGGCWEVEGVRRSWRDPSGGADRGSGGRWPVEEEEVEVEVGSTEDEGGADPGRGGEEEETRFSLLSLPSVSVTPARG